MTLNALLVGIAVAEEPVATLQAVVGADYVSRTDLQLSPRNQDGVAPHVGVAFQRRSTATTHSADLGITLGSLRSQPDYDFTWDDRTLMSAPSPITVVDFRYAVGWQVASGEAWDLRVGGTNANHFEDMVFVAAFTGSSHYFGALELAPWVGFAARTGDSHRVDVEAWVPAVAWIGRNPYAIHSDQTIWNTRDNNTVKTIFRHLADGALAAPWRYQAVHARANWHVDIGRRLVAGAALRADWLHDDDPFGLVELQLGADLTVGGRF